MESLLRGCESDEIGGADVVGDERVSPGIWKGVGIPAFGGGPWVLPVTLFVVWAFIAWVEVAWRVDYHSLLWSDVLALGSAHLIREPLQPTVVE